jgi:hypothetical protein
MNALTRGEGARLPGSSRPTTGATDGSPSVCTRAHIAAYGGLSFLWMGRDGAMEPVEIQLARLMAMFEAAQRLASDRHGENVERLVRIEYQVRETNGRVNELEKWQAVEAASAADEDRKPITKRDWIIATGALAGGYGLLKAFGLL